MTSETLLNIIHNLTWWHKKCKCCNWLKYNVKIWSIKDKCRIGIDQWGPNETELQRYAPIRRDYVFKTKSTTSKNSIFNVVRFLPFYSNDHIKWKVNRKRVWLRPPYGGNLQILVISIVIDSDRGHCHEHFKKKLFMMKI